MVPLRRCLGVFAENAATFSVFLGGFFDKQYFGYVFVLGSGVYNHFIFLDAILKISR